MALTNKLSAIGNAIREKTGKTDLLTLDQMPQEISSIETGGSIDYIPYVKSITFSKAILEITDDIYLDLPNATSLANIFFALNVNCKKITLKISNLCTNLQGAFRQNENLKEVEILGDLSGCTDFSRVFYGCSTLETIKGELDFSSVTIYLNSFHVCPNLITFMPKPGTIKVNIMLSYSPNLSDESIQAVINGLADLTGQTTQTLTLHADVKAKLTETQIASITSKNWTLA